MKTPKEQITELMMGKTIEEIERNNTIVEQALLIKKLERELAEARDQLVGAGKLMKACDVLVRDLAEARKQRDTLAEALRGPVNAAKAADSPGWSEPGESGWYVEEYERTNAKNWLANTKNWLPEAIEALAAVKGGSHE